jgi:hypothetical protein
MDFSINRKRLNQIQQFWAILIFLFFVFENRDGPDGKIMQYLWYYHRRGSEATESRVPRLSLCSLLTSSIRLSDCLLCFVTNHETATRGSHVLSLLEQTAVSCYERMDRKLKRRPPSDRIQQQPGYRTQGWWNSNPLSIPPARATSSP